MSKLQRLSAEDRDNLVAYLDGELDESGTRRIEGVLGQSSVARTDVEQLARTYDLLDELDTPKASESFTERTIASAKLEQIKPSLAQHPWFVFLRRVSPIGGWAIVMVVAAAIGFSITRLGVPQDDDVLLENYPVIKELDVYSETGNYEFLDRLSREQELLDQMSREAHRESQ
ncbi:MAG: hypothetical protein KDA69_01970 [Planctomycetaceae bacterium]|nr:hypothetical protein [Planctomycetaceae bacterium]MCA9043053.1 hypothetical protein [Planctomycetaceae bacterium]MCB9950265.1 hypothetical protein [Planctomycetaceae bacterium]